MFDRAFKITMIVGVCAAVVAITMSVVHGTVINWKWGDATHGLDIKFNASPNWATGLLGAIAIICLLLGAAFFAITKNPNAPQNMSNEQKPFSFLTFLQNLKRSKSDCWLGGVCGGLGTHTPIPSWVWRMIFLLLLLCMGTGVLAYIILWICIPEEKPAA
jgi:phage shock protein C